MFPGVLHLLGAPFSGARQLARDKEPLDRIRGRVPASGKDLDAVKGGGRKLPLAGDTCIPVARHDLAAMFA